MPGEQPVRQHQLMQVLPLAFIAKSDEESAVAALWSEVWEDGTTSVSAALRMYMAELVPLITAGASCLLTSSGLYHAVMSAAIINCLYCVSQHTVIPPCTGASLACIIAAAWACMHCLLVVHELILQ